jgi:hypothetical protein
MKNCASLIQIDGGDEWLTIKDDWAFDLFLPQCNNSNELLKCLELKIIYEYSKSILSD